MSWAKTCVPRFFLPMAMLVLWLVPTGQAQTNTIFIVGQYGQTRVRPTAAISSAQLNITQTFSISAPYNANNVFFTFENSGAAGNVTYSVNFAPAGTDQQTQPSGPATFCTHNPYSPGLFTNGTGTSFSSTLTPLSIDVYSCPITSPRIIVNYTPSASAATAFSINAFFGAQYIQGSQVSNRYSHITTATNTSIKGASGFVHTVSINGGTAGAVTLFDASAANCTGGNTVAIIQAAGAGTIPVVTLDIFMLNGICVTTAAATDVTVTWK